MKCVLALTVLPATLAWNAEYPGFVHFRNWDGHYHDLQHVTFSDGSALPLGLAKDFCSLDVECNTFGGDGGYMRSMSVNSSTDLYLANDSSIVASAICEADASGPGSSQLWLACSNDNFNQGQGSFIGSFNLPPDLIHSSCKSNPLCIGFRVNNDGTSGTLFKEGTESPGWFALPASLTTPTKKTTYKHTLDGSN